MDSPRWLPTDTGAVRELLEGYWRRINDQTWALYLERMQRYPPGAVKLALRAIREEQERVSLPGIPQVLAKAREIAFQARRQVQGPVVEGPVVTAQEIAMDEAIWWSRERHPTLGETYRRMRDRMRRNLFPCVEFREPGEEE